MRVLTLTALLALSTAGIVHAEPGAQRADFLRQAAVLYDDAPNISLCKSGHINDAQKQTVLDTLNTIRALHGLGPVVYDTSSDDEVMSAALLMAANGKLSHTPPADWKCWSVLGADGAGHSNLTGGVISPYLDYDTTEQDIIHWLTDTTNAVPGHITHRRWLLDPFLKKVAYGRVAADFDGTTVTDGAALKILYEDETDAVSGDTIAWPVGNYPAKYFADGVPLSFSVVAGKENKLTNQSVDFSKASVSIRLRDGSDVVVSDIAFDNIGSGLPNNLQFKTDALEHGVIYDVTIAGVKIGPKDKAITRDYSYWFRIVD